MGEALTEGSVGVGAMLSVPAAIGEGVAEGDVDVEAAVLGCCFARRGRSERVANGEVEEASTWCATGTVVWAAGARGAASCALVAGTGVGGFGVGPTTTPAA